MIGVADAAGATCGFQTALVAGTSSAPAALSGSSTLPDLDGDGAADVWVFAEDAWWVSGARVSSGGTLYMDEDADAHITGAPALTSYGAVDRDGDGVAGELLVAAPYADRWRGGAWLLPTEDLIGEVALADVASVTFQADGAMQDRLGCAGDVLDFDGDGHEDVALGSRHPNTGAVGGRAYVFAGDSLPDGAAPSWLAEWQFYNDGGAEGIGKHFNVHSGDLDRDGRDELLLSAPEGAPVCDAPPEGVGGVLIWYGGLSHGAYGPSTFDACIVAPPLEGFGSFVGVDDIDGDGSLDLLISSLTGNSAWGGFFRTEAW